MSERIEAYREAARILGVPLVPWPDRYQRAALMALSSDLPGLRAMVAAIYRESVTIEGEAVEVIPEARTIGPGPPGTISEA